VLVYLNGGGQGSHTTLKGKHYYGPSMLSQKERYSLHGVVVITSQRRTVSASFCVAPTSVTPVCLSQSILVEGLSCFDPDRHVVLYMC
jgi:hypothetical protein